MIEQFGDTRMSTRLVASKCARQTTPELSAEGSPAGDHPVREAPEREQTTALPVRRDRRLDWQMLALWAFVVVSFAALGFALLTIWVKCGGQSPF